MTIPKKILLTGIITGKVSLVVLLVLTVTSVNNLINKSIFFGDAIAFLNFILGLLCILYGINKSNKIFLISLFGGLLLRLTIMLALVLISLKFLDIKEISFIFSLLFFYFFYVIIEVIYLYFSKKSQF